MIQCFFSGEDANFISQWEQIFKELNMKATLFQMNKDWEQNPVHFHSSSNAPDSLIIVSKRVIETSWFKFLTGYCLGRNSQLFLYMSETDVELPPYLEYAKRGKSIDDLKAHLTVVSIQKEKMLLNTSAKEELSKRGIYFTDEYFFLCIKKNNIEAIEFFLKAGFSSNATTDNGVPALCLAAGLGFYEICHLLLKYQSDISAVRSDNGNNALMEAVAHSNSELARLFIDYGINLDAQSKNGQTALMLAVGRGDAEIVEFILQAESNIECRDVLGMTAEQYAKILRYEQILSLFTKYKK